MRASWLRLCSRRASVPPNPHAELDYARHMPKAYVEKTKRLVPDRLYVNRFASQWRRHSAEDYVETGARPWERTARSVNAAADRYRPMRPQRRFEHPDHPTPEPIPAHKWTVLAGDLVRVMVGQDKGKDGFVKAVARPTNHVYVAGLHMEYELEEAGEQVGISGQYVAKERPLDVSRGEVMLLDPEDNAPTDAHWRLQQHDDGASEWVRVSQRTGRLIPIPSTAKRTYQYYLPEDYAESDKDTTADVVLLRTYTPTVKTFEQEIMDEMNIVDERKHGKTYWY